MANIQVQNVQRLRFQAVTTANFAVDMTTALGAFADLPFVEGTAQLTLNKPTESPGYARQDRDDHPEEIILPESWELTFDINLGVPDARAATGTTINQTPVGALLALVMGGEKLGIGDTINGTSATANVLPVDTIGRFEIGQVIGCANTSGVLELRPVAQITGSTVRVKQNFSFVPADADAVYGCATYSLGNDASASVQTAQFVLEGLGTNPNFEDTWVLIGGQATATFSIALPNNGIPRMTVTFTGHTWYNGDDAAMTPAALAAATYSETNEVVVVDSQHLIQTVGTTATTGATYMVTELTVTPDIYYLPHESSGGTNGVAGYVMDANHPKVTGSFTIAYEDQTWSDAHANKTNKAYQYQIGSSESNGAALIDMPSVQITNFQRPNTEGIAMQSVEFKGRADNGTSGTATALSSSPIRIGIA